MAVIPVRLRPLFVAIVAAFAVALAAWPAPADARSGWDGSLDLYRPGTFTTQKSWLWCTAAGVQIASNIVDRRGDHSTSGQRRYFEWMRRHNRYDLPLSAGIDPAGWTAGLRHFVDDRYRLVASKSFNSALRLAAQRMRATNLPVALTVSRGNHGWILSGFSATADPATAKDFRVTSVRVVGPLYGLRSRTYGYDMRPGTSLTTQQLRRFFTPWWYAPKRMVWDGLYVSIQPVPVRSQIAKPLPAVLPKSAASPFVGPSPSSKAAVDPAASPAGPSVAAPTAIASPPSSPTASTPGRTVTPDPIMAVATVVIAGVLSAGLVIAIRRKPPGSVA